MTIGKGGIYDPETLAILRELSAKGVVLIVVGGLRGSGFSVVLTPDALQSLPTILEETADLGELERRQENKTKELTWNTMCWWLCQCCFWVPTTTRPLPRPSSENTQTWRVASVPGTRGATESISTQLGTNSDRLTCFTNARLSSKPPGYGLLTRWISMIKRYANRRLYDQEAGRYITIDWILERIRRGEMPRVIAHPSGKDVTGLVYSSIVSEEIASGRIGLEWVIELLRRGEARCGGKSPNTSV